MREIFTSGSVGRAPGNRCLYPEADGVQLPLKATFGFEIIKMDIQTLKRF
jgi:hypothetical protein